MSSRPNSATARSTMLRQCGLVRDVAGNEHDPAAGLLDPARGLPRVVLLLGQVGDQDIGAFAGEGDGHGAADAAVAAGDDRGAALELAGAFVRTPRRGRAWASSRPCGRAAPAAARAGAGSGRRAWGLGPWRGCCSRGVGRRERTRPRADGSGPSGQGTPDDRRIWFQPGSTFPPRSGTWDDGVAPRDRSRPPALYVVAGRRHLPP